MFKFKYLILPLLALVALAAGCKRTEFIPVGEPFSHYKGIQGTYKLYKVVQVDEVTSNINKTLDVTDLYVVPGGQNMSITFADSTVSVNAGDTPNYLTTGTAAMKWHFDEPAAPTYVIATDDQGNSSQWKLLNPVREPFDKQLNLVVQRTYAGKLSVSYQMYFAE